MSADLSKLQQCLPFTVLKPCVLASPKEYHIWRLQQCLPFTVLKHLNIFTSCGVRFLLQQCLPFTVLKRYDPCYKVYQTLELQQCLPFTVLKLKYIIKIAS